MNMKKYGDQRSKRSSLISLRIAVLIATFLVVTVGVLWILSSANAVSSQGAAIFSAIFSVFSILVALLQLNILAEPSQKFFHSFDERLHSLFKFLKRSKLTYRIIPILLISLLGSALIIGKTLWYNGGQSPSVCGSANATNGIGTTKAANGECIGISDGQFAFDTNRTDGKLKLEAAQSLQADNPAKAMALWQDASTTDTNDAEALIYQENQRTLTSPHITIVIDTTLTGSSSSVNLGRDILQGAYVAQKEYNEAHSEKIRLLIANVGSQTHDATTIVQQVIQIAQHDQSIVAVLLGCPFNADIPNVVQTLAKADIPIISPTLSSNELTNISPYFFRIVPPNEVQAQAAAQYASKILQAKRAIVFSDTDNFYSEGLAQDFIKSFSNAGGTIVAEESYIAGQPKTLSTSLHDALSYNPDLIYFAGDYTDVSTLLQDIPTSGRFSTLRVMGGNRLYPSPGGDYPANLHASFGRLYFTAFAFPDEWAIAGQSSQPAFFKFYPQFFDPRAQHTGNPYGYTRPDSNVMLSYDAMSVLLRGSDVLLSQGIQHFTPRELQQAIGTIHVQGVSGQIIFDAQGNPINKTILILRVSSGGFLQLTGQMGQLSTIIP